MLISTDSSSETSLYSRRGGRGKESGPRGAAETERVQQVYTTERSVVRLVGSRERGLMSPLLFDRLSRILMMVQMSED